VVATTASGYTNVAGAPDCATSTTRCRWQKSHNNTRLEQREGCCPVLPPSAMTVLLQLLMAATAHDGCHRRGQTTSATTRLLQHEGDMGKITIMPFSFVYGCLSVRIMILPLQLISNYF